MSAFAQDPAQRRFLLYGTQSLEPAQKLGRLPLRMMSPGQRAWSKARAGGRWPLVLQARALGIPLHHLNEALAYHDRMMAFAGRLVRAGKLPVLRTGDRERMVQRRSLHTHRSTKRKQAGGRSRARTKHREKLERVLLQLGMLESKARGEVSPLHESEAEAVEFAPQARQLGPRLIPYVKYRICGKNRPQTQSAHKSFSKIPLLRAAYCVRSQRELALAKPRDRRGRFAPRTQQGQGPQAASPAQAPANTAPREEEAQNAAQDANLADAAWAREQFSRHRATAGLNFLTWIGTCYPRSAWRGAVAGLAAMAPGAVRNPACVVAALARRIAHGEIPDPRSKPSYFAHAGWGRALLMFARVEHRAK